MFRRLSTSTDSNYVIAIRTVSWRAACLFTPSASETPVTHSLVTAAFCFLRYGAPLELQRALEDAGETIAAPDDGHSIEQKFHLREARRQDHGDLAKFALCGQAYPGICVFVVDNFATTDDEAPPKKNTRSGQAAAEEQDFGDRRHGDSDTFRFGGHPLQAVGVYGRVVIAGTSLADGYCGDAAKTGERFHRCRLSDLPGGKALVASRRALLAQYHHQTSVAEASSGVDDECAVVVDAGLQDVDPEVTIYDSGDNGRLLRDGSLQLRGRDDGTVKIRGYKVPLVMVEKAFTDLEAVSGCVILPVSVAALRMALMSLCSSLRWCLRQIHAGFFGTKACFSVFLFFLFLFFVRGNRFRSLTTRQRTTSLHTLSHLTLHRQPLKRLQPSLEMLFLRKLPPTCLRTWLRGTSSLYRNFLCVQATESLI